MIHARLDFSLRRATPVVLQTEVAECALACLAMVAAHHGHRIDLATLRQRHALSLKGATLADLMRLANALELAPRPLKLDLAQLRELELPCVLHWDFHHFVVLVRIGRDRVVVHDPAMGRRDLSPAEFSRHFTGIALELRPTPAFRPRRERQRLSLAALLGRGDGLGRPLLQVIALAVVLQGFAILAPFQMQWMVDQAVVGRDRDLVAVLGVGFVLLALVNNSVSALRGWLLIVVGTLLNLRLKSRLFRHLVRLPMAWFDRRHLGDVVSKFGSLDAIQRALTTSFLEALIDGVMALATLAMMLLYSLKLSAVALLATALYVVLRLALYRPLRLATEEQLVRGGRAQSHFLESVRGMQCLKLFAREDQRAAAWQNLTVEEFNAGIRVRRMQLAYQSCNGLLFGVENAVTLWLGGLLVLDLAQGSGFSVGMLFAFVAYKSQFVQRSAALVDNLMQLRMLGLHAERVGDVVATLPEPAGLPLAAKAADAQPPVAIALEGVAYRYGEADPLVLDGVDLTIVPGESVAIVGPSGCGKTTLLKLMLGLATPCAGRITIGGVPLPQYGLARWREQVASVMQDDQLFAGSIADNIGFFDPAADPAWVEQCARLASVHDDIAAMPMQYATLVGDMGTVLSGGQKQRILLARALYRRPRVLFLDEATSHLDVARERAVNDAVRALQLTRVIVAHRPETIASADRVVVLQHGRCEQQLRVHATAAVVPTARPLAAG